MKIYMIGIKGSGMSSLAILLKKDGYIISGYDTSDYVYTEDSLKKENIEIDIVYNNIFHSDLVIVGHSFIQSEIIKVLNAKNIPYIEYNKFLKLYLNPNKLISIAGSHGKTTLTKMLGVSFNSSFLTGDGEAELVKESNIFLESCEYKNHFLEYNPKFIIVTNIDYDHVDFFKSKEEYANAFKNFCRKTQNGLIYYRDYLKIKNPYFLTYGFTNKADFYLQNYSSSERGIKGDLYFHNEYLTSFSYSHLFGRPLLEDVCVTLAYAYLNNYDLEEIKNNINKFEMAKKRFNITKKFNQIFINDYAHHPTQIITNYETVVSMYPNRILIGIYRPDRLSRLVYFIKELKEALSLYDEGYVLPFINNENLHYLNYFNSYSVKRIDSINEVIFKLDKSKEYVFILMSSKRMDKELLLLQEFFR